jgi:hypothetical protein
MSVGKNVYLRGWSGLTLHYLVGAATGIIEENEIFR